MAENNNKVAVRANVGDQVIARVETMSKLGFTMPKDYSYVNAIKASLLKLQEVKDKNGKSALEVCTTNSVQSALFEMVTKGLDASKSQCYLIVRGDKLCMHESYFGKILQVRRIFPTFNPNPRVIYKDDVFEYATDVNTGRKVLVKHEQNIENLDKDFVGAYMYIPTADGGQDLFIMSKKMILSAWAKSSSREMTTHKQFTDKMVGKTIISSACTTIINSSPDLAHLSADDTEDEDTQIQTSVQPGYANTVEFQEAEVVHDAVDTEADAEAVKKTADEPAPEKAPEAMEEDEF